MLENENVESTESQESFDSSSTEGHSEQPSIVELDSLEKFKWKGREITPKDLESFAMMQSDYTKKTQAIAEERKYYENLEYDLEAVKRNPSLAEKFKSVYPEKYHKFLGYVSPQQPQQSYQSTQTSQAQGMDPEFMERFNRIEQELNERKVAAVQAELDAKFEQLSKKYPFADEEAVIARAQALLDRGEKLTDQVWDKLWKGVNERYEKLAEARYQERLNKTKQAHASGKDSGAGGGTPGQAPRQPRTIKEASQFAMQELSN